MKTRKKRKEKYNIKEREQEKYKLEDIGKGKANEMKKERKEKGNRRCQRRRS